MPPGIGGIKGSFGLIARLVAPADVVEYRRGLCAKCDNNAMGVCKVCACPIAFKTKLVAASCPLRKWEVAVLYAKVKDGNVLQYPYTAQDLQKENPSTSFSYSGGDISELYARTEDAEATGAVVVPVEVASCAGLPQYEYTLADSPIFDGIRWVLGYNAALKVGDDFAEATRRQSEISIQKINSAAADVALFIRENPDSLSEIKLDEWRAYHDALLALVSSPGFPWDIPSLRKPSE